MPPVDIGQCLETLWLSPLGEGAQASRRWRPASCSTPCSAEDAPTVVKAECESLWGRRGQVTGCRRGGSFPSQGVREKVTPLGQMLLMDHGPPTSLVPSQPSRLARIARSGCMLPPTSPSLPWESCDTSIWTPLESWHIKAQRGRWLGWVTRGSVAELSDSGSLLAHHP